MYGKRFIFVGGLGFYAPGHFFYTFFKKSFKNHFTRKKKKVSLGTNDGDFNETKGGQNMIHLGKKNGGMKTVACTNNPFIKGRVVEFNDFEKVVMEDQESGGRRYCLKCKKKYDRGHRG